MEIYLNQVFWTSQSQPEWEMFESWDELTSGRIGVKLNTYSGMPYFKEVNGRIPMINFHVNPFKHDTKESPWRDIITQQEGRVIYNGDNKDATSNAHETKGNKVVLKILEKYFSNHVSDRLQAPPIVVTEKQKIGKKGGGYKKFIGFGVIVQPPRLVQQYEKGTDVVFSNFQFQVALFGLGDGEKFNWSWVDDRRDRLISDEDALKQAPKSWKRWVKGGSSVIPECQLRILNYKTYSNAEQREMSEAHRRVLEELLERHYPNPTMDGLRFEAMASFVTELFFDGFRFHRGWITSGSGDRGVDFVGRLDIGDGQFARTSLIVLGQSKRYQAAISGEKVTRIASRMTRGYIGVVVTLDTFTEAVQHEIKDDKLPIIMINGKKVAELLLQYINMTGKSLREVVEEQDEWSRSNVGDRHYETVLTHI